MTVKKQAQPEQKTTKVYIYTRVSTTMQIDGYSLDAQRARLKAYADFNGFEIVGGEFAFANGSQHSCDIAHHLL